MKVIISHDIDHITVSEHLFRDLILPKFILRMKIELLSGKIDLKEYILRWGEILKNKWQNIDELITFNNSSDIPNSFFISSKKGKGLNYSNDSALVWIEQMKLRNCEIGNHAINYKSLLEVVVEKYEFAKLSSVANSGVRMHYLQKNNNTLKYLSQAGYIYDSSVHAFINPYKIGQMWEFPIQIMDGWIMQGDKRWQTVNFKKAQEKSKIIIEKAFASNLEYFSIVFHDRYFNKGFNTWLNWYIWIVEYLRSYGVETVDFKKACKYLNDQNN